MENNENINLEEREWKDFSTYPERNSSIIVTAEGYDTIERKNKKLEFKIESFNIIDFPSKGMVDELKKHHCHWRYRWAQQN